jgi:hypothetical protein
MLFVGDVSLPAGVEPEVTGFPGGPETCCVATLEGAITDVPRLRRNALTVHQGPGVIPFLKRLGVRAVSLATNHLLDASTEVHPTRAHLAGAGVLAFGGGDSAAEAARAVVVSDEGREIALLGFGWEAIGCRAAREDGPGVNPLRLGHVIHSIERERRARPDALVVVVCHWGYELEPLPHPLQVDLARRAVDAGASAVVGSHPHCVLGGEIYAGVPILYGLGNWYVAEGNHFGWALHYPPLSRRQLVFEWDPDGGAHRVHWFEADAERSRVTHTGSALLVDDTELAALSPFRDLSPHEYEVHFRTHRRKRKGLPVYRRADATIENWIKDRWVALRARVLTLALRLGLKGGPR